jgi:hypothetical protein
MDPAWATARTQSSCAVELSSAASQAPVRRITSAKTFPLWRLLDHPVVAPMPVQVGIAGADVDPAAAFPAAKVHLAQACIGEWFQWQSARRIPAPSAGRSAKSLENRKRGAAALQPAARRCTPVNPSLDKARSACPMQNPGSGIGGAVADQDQVHACKARFGWMQPSIAMTRLASMNAAETLDACTIASE